MGVVTELGYVGLHVSDPEAWKDYAANCIAAEVLDEGDSDRFYLRLDNWHHRLVLHVGDQDDLAYLGWRVADAAALIEIREKLSAAGIEVRVGTPEEAAERHVLGLLKLADPTGNPTEIFYGPRIDQHLPFHPGRRMHGRFVTGTEGLGHCVIRSDDAEASHRFYSLLGLKGSIEYHLRSPMGTLMPVFMRCNDRQHSVAFGIPTEKRLNHMMLEYTDMDDLGMSHDTVRSRNIPVALQLGKHSNDQALTFYSATPSGWLMELGWGAVKGHVQQQYHVQDVFGHGMESAGMGLDVDL